MARLAAGALTLALLALVLITAAAPAAADTANPQASDRSILYVFDVSGSMGDSDDQGVPKLEGAKSAVIDTIYNLPTTAQVGVWAYPAQGNDCGPGASILKVNALDTSLLTAEIQQLQPDGQTPTAAALRGATESLKSEGYIGGTIVLVSDGLANCSDDPCEVAAQIRDEGFDLTVETTGFAIDTEGREQLTCIAEATGGQYVDVSNSDQLAARLAAASQAALELQTSGLNAQARAGGAHTITATVRNTNTSVAAKGAIATLTFGPGGDAVYPAVLPPRVQLGSIPPGETVRYTWTISTGNPGVAHATVIAQAAGLNPAQTTGTVTIVDKDATLDEAGSILRDATRIVIVGDSYSSGEGTFNYVDLDTASAACHRSLDAYALHLYGVSNDDALIACSGAVTADYSSPNPDRGRDAQRNYLYDLFRNPETAPQVVLLTFGGNDIGFADIVKRCAEPDDCTQLHTSDTLVKDIGTIPPNWAPQQYQRALNMGPTLTRLYESVYDTIRRSSNNGAAQIPVIVLPYLQIITNTIGDGCSNMNNNERQFGVQLLTTLNKSIAAAVNDARNEGIPVHFARDVTTAILPGHTACADRPEDRYVNSLDLIKALPGPSSATLAKCTAALAMFDPVTKPALIKWCASSYAKQAGAKAQELMHPNAGGHRAITNALVDWSSRPETEADWAADKTEPIDTSGLLRVTDPLTTPAITVGTTVNMNQQLQGNPSVSAGGALTLQGAGYAPNSQVRVVVRSTPTTLGTTIAADDGTVTTTVIMPTDFPRGAHAIQLEGYDTKLQPLTLEQPITVIAYTPRWVALVGISALLALVAAIVLQLRSRHQRPQPSSDRH